MGRKQAVVAGADDDCGGWAGDEGPVRAFRGFPGQCLLDGTNPPQDDTPFRPTPIVHRQPPCCSTSLAFLPVGVGARYRLRSTSARGSRRTRMF